MLPFFVLFVLAILAVAIAYYMMEKARIRRHNKRIELQERQEQLLQQLLKSKDPL